MTVSPRMPDLFNTESNSEDEIKSRIEEEELTHHLTFYTNPMSRGRIARRMLEEVGVPYEVEILPFGPRMKQQDYRAINPMGKVPPSATMAPSSPNVPRSAPIWPKRFPPPG